MKTPILFVAPLLALSALAASAQEGTQLVVPPSTLTRAEVKAELMRARAAGEIVNGNDAEWHGTRTAARSPHVAEFARARETGRTREEVRAEARAALRAQAFDPAYAGG